MSENDHGLSLSEFAFLFDEFGKGSSVAVLVNQVVVVGGSEHLYEFDDVGVVNLGQNGDLVVGELTEFWGVFELLDVHDFDCVILVGFAVLGLVDVAVLTLADLFEEGVVLDHFVH